MSIIQLTSSAQRIIETDAKDRFPNECCGFLFGKDDTTRIVTEARKVINIKPGDQSRRFEISAKAYIDAELYALENDLQLLGIYHSHPNHPAIASEHDLAVAQPYFSYVIVSVIQKEIAEYKSWRLRDEERFFDEEYVSILTTKKL